MDSLLQTKQTDVPTIGDCIDEPQAHVKLTDQLSGDPQSDMRDLLPSRSSFDSPCAATPLGGNLQTTRHCDLIFFINACNKYDFPVPAGLMMAACTCLP